MAREDAERWDERHSRSDQSVDSRAPDALADAHLIDLVPESGRALDVACGRGGQTLWLALRGLDVIALDASSIAIDLLRSHTSSDDAAFGDDVDHVQLADRIDARVHDLDHGLPDDAIDLDVIVCQRFRDTSLYGDFVDRLRSGGLLVLTVLSQVGAESGGPFRAPPGELVEAFSSLAVEVVHQIEGDGLASIVARRT